MKKIVLFSCLALFIGLLFTSCNKEDAQLTSQDGLLSLASTDIDLTLEVKEGRLVFNDLEHLSNTLNYLSANENRYFTSEALDDWEASIGFESVRQKFDNAMSELDKLESLQEFNEFKVNNADMITFNDDNVPFEKLAGTLSYVTESKFFSYIMGNEIHAYKDDLTIAIPLEFEDMLPEIYENPITNEDLGIFVMDNRFLDISEAQLRDCNGASNLSCEDTEGNKKVTGQFLLQILFGDLEPGDNNTVVRDFRFHYKAISRSLKRKLWWWGKNHGDDLQFGTGWGAQYDMPPLDDDNPCTNYTHEEVCHGTGWTSNSAEIVYSFVLEDWWTAPAWAWGNCNIPINREFLYNINFVQNNDVNGLKCDNSCFTRVCQ